MVGYRHSEEAKRKIGSNTPRKYGDDNVSRRPDVRLAISRGQRRAWRNKKVRARRSAALAASWKANHDLRVKSTFTDAYRLNHSKVMKGRCPTGRPAGGRKVWYVGNAGRICMRSFAEVKYAKMLDRQRVSWLYECTTFLVGHKTWTPDFYLPDQKRFVEIKGWLLPDARRKILAAIEHYDATDFELKIVKDSCIFDIQI